MFSSVKITSSFGAPILSRCREVIFFRAQRLSRQIDNEYFECATLLTVVTDHSETAWFGYTHMEAIYLSILTFWAKTFLGSNTTKGYSWYIVCATPLTSFKDLFEAVVALLYMVRCIYTFSVPIFCTISAFGIMFLFAWKLRQWVLKLFIVFQINLSKFTQIFETKIAK